MQTFLCYLLYRECYLCIDPPIANLGGLKLEVVSLGEAKCHTLLEPDTYLCVSVQFFIDGWHFPGEVEYFLFFATSNSFIRLLPLTYHAFRSHINYTSCFVISVMNSGQRKLLKHILVTIESSRQLRISEKSLTDFFRDPQKLADSQEHKYTVFCTLFLSLNGIAKITCMTHWYHWFSRSIELKYIYSIIISLVLYSPCMQTKHGHLF